MSFSGEPDLRRGIRLAFDKLLTVDYVAARSFQRQRPRRSATPYLRGFALVKFQCRDDRSAHVAVKPRSEKHGNVAAKAPGELAEKDHS